MRGRTRADVVGVYFPGEPIGNPTKIFIPRKEAKKAVDEGRAVWRDHRQKVRFFRHWREELDDKTIRDQRGTRGRSANPDGELMFRYAAGSRSENDFSARVAIDCWAGKVKPGAEVAGASRIAAAQTSFRGGQ
jgi:hypothetical protein